MRIADLLPVLSVGARRLAGGAPWRDATTLLPPTSLYCTQFRNSFLTRCPTSESQGPYVGKLKAQSSSIQLSPTYNAVPWRLLRLARGTSAMLLLASVWLFLPSPSPWLARAPPAERRARMSAAQLPISAGDAACR